MPRILHITAHMGGGVGKALSGVSVRAKETADKYQHRILMLEPPEKSQFVESCTASGVDVVVSSGGDCVHEEIARADIVQLEWWHHPLMEHLLSEFPSVPARVVMWCHVSGCNYPVVPFELTRIPRCFIFTSQYSLENPYWGQGERELVRDSTRVIPSSGGFHCVNGVGRARRENFNVGYVGTLSYSKIHPDFVDYCAAVDIPGVNFILVGDAGNRNSIENAAQRRRILDRIKIVGYSSDVVNEYRSFDVFGYPLNPQHFGTAENAMLEAMATGLPVVALNQAAERYLITHMETGLLAKDISEYANYIKYLYNNPEERERIGNNARKFVLKEYDVQRTVDRLNEVYNFAMQTPPTLCRFDSVVGNTPHEWFLSCLGKERRDFEDSLREDVMAGADIEVIGRISSCPEILRGKSKSSLYQFAKYFPGDQIIAYWLRILALAEPQPNERIDS